MNGTMQEVVKREADDQGGAEGAGPRRTYTPAVDILEKKDEITVTADMPGADERSVDITLEKNMLTIRGRVQPQVPEGCRLAFEEYVPGDYQRAFTIGEEIDRDRITASLKNGVLRLTLPKAAPDARKISVSAA